MIALALVALMLSAIPLALLCIGDPKRRRAVGVTEGTPTATRRLLAAAACAPGIGCALLGDAAALMMWLGGCALIGWAAAAVSAHRARPVQ
ncbi:hypothetical protein [Sphingomonas turrisvirgatae]|uniref:DUF3325 domain-containing protein n=1 Tax=Sphingomonas turrisvirgatae TaxID=1888892 RepID=A0A1E3LY32_9SPHN|nr:hypothetical protein [Sphingomonas turrisvirgatae]ODP38696.1 hypothetical protein BFL28_01300 [Sphingomonas turrisvirgatae]